MIPTSQKPYVPIKNALNWGVDYCQPKVDAEAVARDVSEAAGAFPPSVSEGVEHALSQSLQKVLEAQSKGEIDSLEAATGAEMLREMTEGLKELRNGELRVIGRRQPSENVQLLRLEAEDGDVYAVTTRRHADDHGQARIAIKQIADDGVPLPNDNQMYLRLDHCDKFGTSVDVQFGWDRLNTGIHGLAKDDQGDTVISEFGTPVVKHHFQEGLSPEVNEPEGFARCVDAFSNGVLAVF